MKVVRRMRALETQAAKILVERGYEPVIVSTFVRSCRYIAFNLAACRRGGNGIPDSLVVKIRISLHPIGTLSEAAEFCHDEIKNARRFFTKKVSEEKHSRFEVWIAVPKKSGFQQFGITPRGMYEIRSSVDRYCCARGSP